MSSRFGLKFPYYIKNFTKDVKENGVKEALRRILHMRDMKYGKLVGTDKFGNKYFEDYQFEVAGEGFSFFSLLFSLSFSLFFFSFPFFLILKVSQTFR